MAHDNRRTRAHIAPRVGARGRPLSLLLALAALEQTSAARCDQAHLRSGRSVAAAGRRVADVLVVASSVRVLNGVHGGTADLGPAVALDAVLVVVVASLQHRLVHAAASRHDAHDGAAGGGQRLPGARGHPNAGLPVVVGVAHHHAGRPRRARDPAAVGGLLLAHGDDGALWHLPHWHHVAHGELGLVAAVDELAGVQALHGHHQLLLQLVAVLVVEDDLCQGGAAARVVNDVLDKPLDVPGTLGIVRGTELHGALPKARLGCEDKTLALARSADDATHG